MFVKYAYLWYFSSSKDLLNSTLKCKVDVGTCVINSDAIIKIMRSIKFGLFTDAYNLCGKQPEKYISNNFKRFVDESFPQKYFSNPLRKAMLTGYFLRCAENIVGQRALREPDQQIKDILSLKENDYEKIEKIANYLDNHNKIGLSEKISDYLLIPYQDVQRIFEEYAEDLITETVKEQKINREKIEIFHEVAYRNIAFGYLYGLSEEFLKNKK